MKREIIITADGSSSIAIPVMGVTYHSTHGAIQESMHVFINAGLHHIQQHIKKDDTMAVLEMGFGTGLNALLTIAAAEKMQQKIFYETIELYPLESSMVSGLNYCEQLQRPDLLPFFDLIHYCPWNTIVPITPYFDFRKNQTDPENFSTDQLFNVIYFDAFAPDVQPGLWTAAIFSKLYGLMRANASLTTYCSKSVVRKAMTEAGLHVEKIPGPPHKREMVRASRRL